MPNCLPKRWCMPFYTPTGHKRLASSWCSQHYTFWPLFQVCNDILLLKFRPLITYNVEQFFICIPAICLSAVLRHLWRLLLIWPFLFLLLGFLFVVIGMFQIASFTNIFSVYGLSSHSLDVFLRAEACNFNEVHLPTPLQFFVYYAFGVFSKEYFL